jgi:hypothetical protein
MIIQNYSYSVMMIYNIAVYAKHLYLLENYYRARMSIKNISLKLIMEIETLFYQFHVGR